MLRCTMYAMSLVRTGFLMPGELVWQCYIDADAATYEELPAGSRTYSVHAPISWPVTTERHAAHQLSTCLPITLQHTHKSTL